MRKLLLMVFLPVALFALERVNLIKDAGFEKNNGNWNSYTSHDSALVSPHDSEKSLEGLYSGFEDTRTSPVFINYDSAVVIQGFNNKTVADIESLFVNLAVKPLGKDFGDSLSGSAFVGLHTDEDQPTFKVSGYFLMAPDFKSVTPPSPWNYIETRSFFPDTAWHLLSYPIKKQLLDLNVSAEATVDSFVLIGWGGNVPPWRGQKIYWDDIRLTGYADYDVGIKGILSGDTAWTNTSYTPTARIKNFGRKAADSFLVIATIEGGSGIVYADTLSWSLTADTEDTLSFKEFKPSDAANYTLTVSTIMTPDESDEDDAVSRTLFGTAVAEPVLSPQSLSLQIEGVLRAGLYSIRYSLPLGERGTISLYDPAGRRIESLKVAGSGSISLKSSLSSGVYFVKLETGKTSITRKFAVLH